MQDPQQGRKLRTLSASQWREMAAAARKLKDSQLNVDDEGGRIFERDSGTLKLKNQTGGTQARYSVVGIGAAWVTPSAGATELDVFKLAPAVGGMVPYHEHRGRFAIVQDGVLDGGVVDAVASGVTICRVLVQPGEEAYEYADVETGATDCLRAVKCGSARILWREAGTCERWAIVRLGDQCQGAIDATYGTTSTTTATPGTTPNPNQPCSGTCKWTWSASANQWTQTTSGCGAGTTSTTTSTTSTTTPAPSTTSTTPAICPRPAATTTTSTTTSSTTTSSTTSTTPAPCACSYPTFCGSSDGDCTWTGCIQGQQAPPPTSCTTTTTTSSTTTTTCNCNTTTTTTAAPGCSVPCSWQGQPTASGSWQWVKVSDSCSPSCPCGTPTGDPYCQATTTDCQQTTTTPAPPPPPCTGGCVYWWIPGASDWKLTINGCNQSAATCGCAKPSFPGSACGSVSMPCAAPAATTTTTTGAPCAYCYGTTTTTSSTTTTPAPCSGNCGWKYSTLASAWYKVIDPCAPTCPCAPPSTTYTGESCEITPTPCTGTTTTTTSTTTTTTTTTTTSTTTTPPPCGTCTYGQGIDNVVLIANNCTGGCSCSACAAPPGTIPGGLWVCPCASVTTTTAPPGP